MSKYLRRFENYEKYQEFVGNPDEYIVPNVCTSEDDGAVYMNPIPHDFSNDYMSFFTYEETYFKFSATTGTNIISYSTDDGDTWSELESNVITGPIPAKTRILMKGECRPTTRGIGKFYISGKTDVEGNIMSLVYGDDFIGKLEFPEGCNNMFYSLLNANSALTRSDNFYLPATALTSNCYRQLFGQCQNLETTPKVLPAKTLPSTAYHSMFSTCKTIKRGPVIAAENIGPSSCQYMFSNCSGLMHAPKINGITSTGASGYCQMFSNCTSLTTAPEIPTNLVGIYLYDGMFMNCSNLVNVQSAMSMTTTASCYQNMFAGCTSLKKTPILPAETVEISAYNSMFSGCTSLTEISDIRATTMSQSACYKMFYQCSSIVTPPVLSASSLGPSCYMDMFALCTNLESAPELPAMTVASYAYCRMFASCYKLTVAPSLPATTLDRGSYYNMFLNCSGLTTPPSTMSAQILPDNCCESMFSSCISLTETPSLTITEIGQQGCFNMFNGCKNLKTSKIVFEMGTLLGYSCCKQMFYKCEKLENMPDLPATSLANDCYNTMFSECSALTSVTLSLPAQTLASGCYQQMFYNCTSMQRAPELPATTLVSNCYSSMFGGCTSLNYIKAMFTTAPGSSYTSYWVSSVPRGGTFVKNAQAQWSEVSDNAVPDGWTIVTE